MRHPLKRPLGKAVAAWVLSLGLCVCGGALAAGESPASARIVVVANPALGIQTMTRRQVRDAFLGELRYLKSIPLSPVTYLDNSPVADVFLAEMADMSENQFKSWWIKRIFRYGDLPPVRVPGSSEMISRVLSTAGAIGYLPEDELPADSPLVVVLRLSPGGEDR